MKIFITVAMTVFCVLFGFLAYVFYLTDIDLGPVRLYGGLLIVMVWSAMPMLFFTLGTQYNK